MSKLYSITLNKLGHVETRDPLTPGQLLGMLSGAVAVFGPNANKHFIVRDVKSGLRQVDALKETKKNDVFLLEGEKAFEAFGEKNWLNELNQYKNVTKKYTVGVSVEEPKTAFYVLQFDTEDFYHGLTTFFIWVGCNQEECLRDLHEGNRPIKF